MQLKQGVRLLGIRPEMVMGLLVCDQVYQELGYDMVVTSVVDGTHSRGSIHYMGGAADLRTYYFGEGEAETAKERIQDRLGPEFDVVLESTHIHVEWQPKEEL